MGLAALLCAQMTVAADDGGAVPVLAALLPVAGMTVIERQADGAAAAGVTRLLLLVDAVPAALVAACDRIRQRGMEIVTVRSGADLAAQIAANERLLLVADGLMAPAFAWQTIAASSGATLLAVADTPATTPLERLDAQSRWAGLAVLPSGAVMALNDMPDDWDPLLTLLRSAVQGGALMIDCDPALFERGDLALAHDPDTARLVEMRMIAAGDADVRGVAQRRLCAPLARATARWLLRHSASDAVARGVQLFAAIAIIASLLWGVPVVAAAGGMVVAGARACGGVIAAFRPETAVLRTLGRVADGLEWSALLALGYWAAGGGGIMLLPWLGLSAALALLLLLGQRLARTDVAHGGWIADSAAFWLTLLGAASVADWRYALAVGPLLAVALLWIAAVRSPARDSAKRPER